MASTSANVAATLDACAQAASLAGPIATALGASVAFLALLVARWYYVRTLVGKLHDRLLELNKLGVQYPKVAKAFFDQAFRSQPFFDSTEVERNEDYYALRAYVLFRLNVYEEAFFATQGVIASSTDDGRAWQLYVKRGFAHPLVAELFEAETQQLGSAFVRFIRSGELPNGEKYEAPAE
ncbi:hypothetical protein OOZ63_02325 [Paucibacter sp. PLA-PC-4]|uniref:hypothetical protein n=1 Tax=Paucibacter sp. PLA-PC-4 TaxID=2993655 RepID=UPI002248C823|nr:hypothetical protein [Paucibacter sp. PLA-PC-4]MCX2860668.1 hypothetical protein [Paucibacter sp. PLA-PC-4]